MSKKTKLVIEVFHGTLSLTILAAIMFLYFSNFSGMSSAIQYIPFEDINLETPRSITGYSVYADLNTNQKNASYDNSSCRFNLPIEKTIILRMDDVQEHAWSKATMNITDTVLNRNMSITLGIIPNRFNDTNRNAPMKKYLLSKTNNLKVEFAQHGANHKDMEYLNLSESEAYNLTKEGYERIVKTFGMYPVTFIPPNNEYNENTTQALSKVGLKIISAKPDEYKFDGAMMHVGFTAQTKYSDKTELEPVNKILNACNKSFDARNICVIVVHPQDYISNDKISLNEIRYVEFVKLLDGLQTLGAKSLTFKDLVTCQSNQ